MNTQKKILSFLGFIIFLLLFGISPLHANASATLSLSPASGSYVKNNTFAVSVNVNTNGQVVNAVTANLTFDTSKLAVVSISTSSSIITFWTGGPTYSNAAGTIYFAGGVPNPGFSGTKLIVTITFKGTTLGSGGVAFAPGSSVLLNDGLGTNIFGSAIGGTYTVVPPPPSVSCSPSSSSALVGSMVTFTALASGGDGTFAYVWSGACTGASSTCASSYNIDGTKTANVTVTSNGQTATGNCSVSVGFPALSISCSSPNSVGISAPATFNAAASGGSGTYTYEWTNACTGSSSTCTKSYDVPGLKTAKVTVTSDGQTASDSCLLIVNPACPDCPANPSCPTNPTCPDNPGCPACICGGSGGSGACVANTTPQHNICSADEKCISAFGSGQNSCQSDADCKSVATNISKCTTTVVTNIIQGPKEQIQIATQNIQKTINTPAGSVESKVISTTGAAVATVAIIGSLPMFEIFLVLLRMFGLFATTFGFRKKVLPWGVVYDSVTKQPLDPAQVYLKNIQGITVASAITDLDGRYGFLVEPGTYQILVRKTNYIFPSQKLSGKAQDELYEDLYSGGSITVKTKGEVISKNIPMDSVKFDWNEFAKKGISKMKFYYKWDVVIKKVYNILFVLGFIVAITSYTLDSSLYNIVIIVLYLIFLLFKFFGLKPKAYGRITNSKTGEPMSFAIIRVMISGLDREITSKSADKYGKYYCLVPPGKYYLKVEKKNKDGSYSLAYTSPDINVSRKGIIKENFKI